MITLTVPLEPGASEMVREEILKQVVFLSRDIRNIRVSAQGDAVEFEAPEEKAAALTEAVRSLAAHLSRSLRRLQRKVLYRSPEAGAVRFAGHADMAGVHFMGNGQVALEGIPYRLFRYFDRVFEDFGLPWKADPLQVPALIPEGVLARCDYFRSFPQYVTFASHLREDVEVIDGFRSRHQTGSLDGQALSDMERPEACLSPALCYHVYHLYENRTIPPFGTVRGICGKCFRFESSNLSDMRRLWDFTMREVVFLGGRSEVLAARDQSIEMMTKILEEYRLAGEIRTASDPFFIAPESVSKTYFQLSSDSKYEVSLMLPNGGRTAVSSHNYHSDFFGRAFQIDVEGAGPMHSVCVGFGYERWVHAFLQQHGSDPGKWPDAVRKDEMFAG
jgi:seryl-tRNA synthetase